MSTVVLTLAAHTNVGKTTLARTLLGRDVGEVRDAPHVTAFADGHVLLRDEAGEAAGDRLELWDTPGFGDSARLAARMRQQGSPLGWLLSQVWDRFTDRPFHASQEALRHVRAASDLVLYLVNAAESPEAAGYIAPEMELLGFVGKPVLVLLNQTGAPRPAADEAAELARWQARFEREPLVARVLPLDAFARCWVQEGELLEAVAAALPGERGEVVRRLARVWAARQWARFDEGAGVVARALAATAAARVREADAPAAERALGAVLADASALATTQLVRLHGLEGDAARVLLQGLEGHVQARVRVNEKKAGLVGGAVAGALAGLKADVATGGLTLGGGLLAGGLIGALSAAGAARGFNRVRGAAFDWSAWDDEALHAAAEALLLRWLAVQHFGRGRGRWEDGDAPAHWTLAARAGLASQQAALAALWAGRTKRFENAGEAETLGAALAPVLAAAGRQALAALYPGAHAFTMAAGRARDAAYDPPA